ncbi:hypothetical protein BX616_010537, partial [Lobosporangium transversale]
MAHWFVSKGIQAGDRVAMMMGNSPLFIITWLSLLKIAAVASFINTQLTHAALVHSLKVSDAKILVFDFEYASALQECFDDIKGLNYDLYTMTPKQQVLGQIYNYLSRDTRRSFEIPFQYDFVEWENMSSEGFQKSIREHIEMSDPAALIFTSGTTGLPKAAIMDHGRGNSMRYLI